MKRRAPNIDSTERDYTDVEINRLIEPKFCKVVTDYGKGTGFFIDDEKGILLTSFHLFGAVQPSRVISLSDIFSIKLWLTLLVNEYIDSENKPTEKSRQLVSSNDIDLSAGKITNKEVCRDDCKLIMSDDLEDQSFFTRHDPDIKQKLFLTLKNDPVTLNGKDVFIEIKEYLILCEILLKNGYIDEECRPTRKAKDLTSKESISLEIKEEAISTSYFINELSIQISISKRSVNIPEMIKGDVKKELFEKFRKSWREKEVILFSTTAEIHFDDEILIGKIYFEERRNCKNLSINYAYHDTVPVRITHFEDGTKFSDRVKVINTGRKISLGVENYDQDVSMLDSPPGIRNIGGAELEIGETVYYGGYPITQENYSFSRGMISSISCLGNREFLVIEAPIVPGNSGAPVFIQRNGQVFFVGIISSEVAQISESIHEIQGNLANMRGGVSESSGGRSVNYVGALRELTDVLLGNLSTGKGKATIIRDLAQLFNDSEDWISRILNELFNQPYDFLVPKKKSPREDASLRLFEYINRCGITQLRMSDMLDYMDTRDKQTKRAVASAISRKGINNGRNYVCFDLAESLTDDVDPKIIKQDTDRINVSNDDIRGIMVYLYTCVYLVSRGIVISNQFRFEARKEIPVHSSGWITQKFFSDHFGGSNRRDARKVADDTSERRGERITTSTTIVSTSLTHFSGEISRQQQFYKSILEIASKNSSDRGRILTSVYFLTLEEYQLEVRSVQPVDRHPRSRFFYSVIEKDERFYAHHFAGTEGVEQKKGWQQNGVTSTSDSTTRRDFWFEDCDPTQEELYKLL